MSVSNKKPKDLNWIAQLWQIFWPPICVFVIHVFLLRQLFIYTLLPWMDIPMHYLGGLSIAYSMFLLLVFLKERHMITPLDRIIELIFIFTLVVTIAVFWEFGEFSIDQILGTNVQLSLQNTIQDLLMGILGASMLIGYKVIKKPK